MKKITSTFLVLSILSSINAQSFNKQNSEKLKDMFIIILDIEKGYTESKKVKTQVTPLIDSINSVIKNADVNKVIYIKSIHTLLNFSLSRPFIYTTPDTSDKWALDNRMNLVNKNIFKKEKSNAFSPKKLNCFLDNNNAKKIVGTGLLAERSVFETLIGGEELGFEMYVIPGAIIGKSARSKRKMMRYYKKKGISILQLND